MKPVSQDIDAMGVATSQEEAQQRPEPGSRPAHERGVAPLPL